MSDDPTPTTETAEATEPTPQAPPEWRAEMDKIIAQRDRAKAEARRLKESSTLTETERVELEALRQAKAEADQKRQVDAGDFESAKAAILKEKEAAEQRAAEAERRFTQKVVESAFHGATDLFGPQGYTTLPPSFAYAALASHVEYEPGENGSGGRMTVRGLDGDVIRGDDGQPADFQVGMRQLIDTWPAKEQILRAGATAGSGSTGGTGVATPTPDRAELVRRMQQGDKDAMAAFRAGTPRPPMRMGKAFEQPG